MNEQIASKINIAGTGISNITLSETMNLFDQWIAHKQRKRVCITPVNCVVWAAKDAQLRELYNSADLTLCDGVPLIWASRFLGKGTLRGRVTGLDLMPQYLRRCHEKGHSMFILGSGAGVSDILQKKYSEQGQPIRVTGAYSPPFAERFSEEENNKIIALINAVKPDIVWVSLTAPKQDRWLFEHFEQLDTFIAIGIGGALEVTAGMISRAPLFMQKNGLEWLYRLYNEPRRLFRRYLVEAPAFIPLILKQWLRER
jgi:N-acetylglucosaminyldiphosphoundecaprenol N-acetyl-beta-D-mannosaminyltransferase